MKRFYTFIFKACLEVKIGIFDNIEDYCNSFSEVSEALAHLTIASRANIQIDSFILWADNEEEAFNRAKEHYLQNGWPV